MNLVCYLIPKGNVDLNCSTWNKIYKQFYYRATISRLLMKFDVLYFTGTSDLDTQETRSYYGVSRGFSFNPKSEFLEVFPGIVHTNIIHKSLKPNSLKPSTSPFLPYHKQSVSHAFTWVHCKQLVSWFSLIFESVRLATFYHKNEYRKLL